MKTEEIEKLLAEKGIINPGDGYEQDWGATEDKWSGKKVQNFLKTELLSIIGRVNQNTTDIAANKQLFETTYSDLVKLRNEGKFLPGALYRITDYITTVANDPEARSAGHPFDVIVMAIDVDTLSEEAMAIQSERDGGYFDECHLEAWKLWYSLDNDEDRFQWADSTNGKGVIYRMIDEWGNDCPYDFKNVQFRRCKVTSTVIPGLNNSYIGIPGISMKNLTNIETDIIWCYTFSKRKFDSSISEMTWEIEGDTSLENIALRFYVEEDDDWYYDSYASCILNKINNSYMQVREDKKSVIILNNIVFLSGIMVENGYESAFYGNYQVNNNSFGLNCYNFSFIGRTYGNCFKENCCNNVSDDYFVGNTFGNECHSNTFGNECHSNTFGNKCYQNTFENYCYYNTFGNECYYNSFGPGYMSNMIGNKCYENTFGDNCYYNTFGNECFSNTFGDNCYRNTFGNGCYRNTFGDNCYYNTLGNGCGMLSFGTYCFNNSFKNNCAYSDFGNSFQGNSIGNGVQYLSILTEKIQYCHILDGTKGIGVNNKSTVSFAANKTSSQYAGLNSSGSLKIWVPADLV